LKSSKHLVIPDCQIRPGVPIKHLAWVGNYIAEKHPDVVVCLGDFADMVSLNSYQVGKASAEGTRYKDDLVAARDAMTDLMSPIEQEITRTHRKWRPRLVMTMGNHEYRIVREAEANPKFLGTISLSDLEYESWGWDVVPFLKPITIDGVAYAHYFVSGVMGRPVGSAAALLRERHGSATMGHVQKVDMAIHPRTQQTGLMAGICYLHDEDYLTPQGQNTRRQIIVKHEVHQGVYDPMFVSLDFLKRKYS
jgi:hypothetical protein